MTYELAFLDSALKEWRRLDNVLREQFKKKLADRLDNPNVPAFRFLGSANRYEIKLRSSGYRLVYEVRDAQSVVVAIGKRERSAVYKAAEPR